MILMFLKERFWKSIFWEINFEAIHLLQKVDLNKKVENYELKKIKKDFETMCKNG